MSTYRLTGVLVTLLVAAPAEAQYDGRSDLPTNRDRILAGSAQAQYRTRPVLPTSRDRTTIAKTVYVLAVRDPDAPATKWADYDTYPTEGQAVHAARAARLNGLEARVEPRMVRQPAPKSHVLWVRDPDVDVPTWKNGGRFASLGEAMAAERAAKNSGLQTSVTVSQGGWTTLPLIGELPKKKAIMYQVLKFDYGSNQWVTLHETLDPGEANDRAIRERSRQTGFSQSPVRVGSKEVMVDPAAYRRSLPSFQR